jgi:hypothetical protein
MQGLHSPQKFPYAQVVHACIVHSITGLWPVVVECADTYLHKMGYLLGDKVQAPFDLCAVQLLHLDQNRTQRRSAAEGLALTSRSASFLRWQLGVDVSPSTLLLVPTSSSLYYRGSWSMYLQKAQNSIMPPILTALLPSRRPGLFSYGTYLMHGSKGRTRIAAK